MTIQIDDTLQLELTSHRQAAALFKAVDDNREHLSVFLPWVGNMQTEHDMLEYLRGSEILYSQQREVSFVIVHNATVVGRIGLHHMNMHNKAAAIGYWLAKSAEGQGIVSRACRAIIDYGFDTLTLHRIEIKAATTNFKSQAIPEKLGFTKEGLLREAELVNGKFLDLFVYAMLRRDWQK